jgi:hypothetical protein
MGRPTADEFTRAFAEGGLPGIHVTYRGEGRFLISDMPTWDFVRHEDDFVDPDFRSITPGCFVVYGDCDKGHTWTEICDTMQDVVQLAHRRLRDGIQEALDALAEARLSPDAVPGAAPVNLGVPVTPVLTAWVDAQEFMPDAMKREVTAGILERSAAGALKYNQVLMSGDGQDSVREARQELLDFLQYAMAARMKGQNLESLRGLVALAKEILH